MSNGLALIEYDIEIYSLIKMISHKLYYVNFRISNEKMKKYVKLSPEFMCYPIWMEEDNLIIPINHHELKISTELKQKIEDWDKQYQSIYVDDYPPDSKFETVRDEQKFIEIGYEIQKALQIELGDDYEVFYQP